LPLMGYLVAIAAHMGAEPELAQVLDMLTTHPARILSRGDAALSPGTAADLVVWDTNRGAEVISALSPCRLVVKGGRVTAEIAHTIAELWRQPLGQPTGTS